jgi:hypothetical protein
MGHFYHPREALILKNAILTKIAATGEGCVCVPSRGHSWYKNCLDNFETPKNQIEN